MKNTLAGCLLGAVIGSAATGFVPGLIFVIVVLVALPPAWDPAIRFKEWTQHK